MKKFYPLAIASAILFTACTKEQITGNGPVVSEQRNSSNFTSVQVSGSTNVIVNQGSHFMVKVTGYSNLLPYFETFVSNGVLQLRYRNNMWIDNDNVQVEVTLPVLSALGISGSSNIQALGNFTGSSSIEASIYGSGHISIAQGITDYFFTSITGSGDVQAFGLVAKKAEVNSSGSGNVELTALQELKVRISGSGSVYYKGTPIVSSQITGSGLVVRR